MKTRILIITLVTLMASVGLGASLSGVVSNVDTGEPIVGASVSIFGFGGGPGGGHDSNYVWIETFSDVNGAYTFTVEEDGNYDLTVAADGYQYYTQYGLYISGDMILDITLIGYGDPPTGDLNFSGVISDTDANPIEGVQVSMLNYVGNQDSINFYWTETYSDENGGYAFENLFPGSCDLTFHARGYYIYSVTVSQITEDLVMNITLMEEEEPGDYYTISGHVNDAETGEPIIYAQIQQQMYGYWANQAITDDAGFYSFMAEGDVSLRVNAWAYAEEVIEVTVDQDLVIDFSLTPVVYDGELYGTITSNETGLALAGVEVMVMGVGPADSSHSWGDWWDNITATTDENGNYSFPNFPNGDVDVWVQYSGYEYFSEIVTIEGVTQFDIALSPLPGVGSLSGYVSYDGGNDPASAFLWLVEVGGWGYETGWTMTDGAGHYQLSVSEGDYYVVCMANNRPDNPGSDTLFYHFEYYDDAEFIENATIVSVLEGGETENINFGIPADGNAVLTARVNGLITDNNNLVMANAEITLQDQAGNTVGTTVTNSSGAYSIEELEVGSTYNLTANMAGYAENSQEFEQAGMISVINLQVLGGALALDDEQIPSSLTLNQNFPNPFNPSTSISFAIPAAASVQVVVYDIIGNQVAELTNTHYSAGNHMLSWNGLSTNGSQVSSGVYFYSLISGNRTITQRMLLTK